MSSILFNDKGIVRSGWRAAIFLFAFILVAVPLGTAGQIVTQWFAGSSGTRSAISFMTNAIVSLVPAILLGWWCGKVLENLPFRALGASLTSGWLKHFLLGALGGTITLTSAVLIAFLLGGIRFEFNQSAMTEVLASLGVSFLIFSVAAAFEEALFRGYILQTLHRSGFAWLAILLTSLFFAAVHAGNPNANVISTANTILAGIWFSVAYLKTRDLWCVWGMHLMWNWVQGAVFGIEVSGLTSLTTAPLMREIDSGPGWLTGEGYGLEGGIACSIALVVSIIVIRFTPTREVTRPQEGSVPP